MSWTTESRQALIGAEVFGADGDKVGTVSEVYPGYIIVEKGFFFPTDYYIPLSAIATYDANRVYLTVSKDAALGRGWDVRPVDLETATVGTTTATTDTFVDTDRLAGARVATDEEIRIPVMEEELTATVREQEAGAVRIEKDVVSEQRTLDVPVTEERVIEVPARTETVDLQKQARVAEEVVISKEAEQRTEQVSGTVRREEVFVDEDATVIDETGGGTPRSR